MTTANDIQQVRDRSFGDWRDRVDPYGVMSAEDRLAFIQQLERRMARGRI